MIHLEKKFQLEGQTNFLYLIEFFLFYDEKNNDCVCF